VRDVCAAARPHMPHRPARPALRILADDEDSDHGAIDDDDIDKMELSA
jgi:hypothetical protein